MVIGIINISSDVVYTFMNTKYYIDMLKYRHLTMLSVLVNIIKNNKQKPKKKVYFS